MGCKQVDDDINSGEGRKRKVVDQISNKRFSPSVVFGFSEGMIAKAKVCSEENGMKVDYEEQV